MKSLLLGSVAAAALLWVVTDLQAQYKAPSQYFRKDSPGQNRNGQPGSPAPAAPAQPKFKDVAVNGSFYFMSDTNREYAWMKTSTTTAKNSKNGNTATINGETPIQR